MARRCRRNKTEQRGREGAGCVRREKAGEEMHVSGWICVPLITRHRQLQSTELNEKETHCWQMPQMNYNGFLDFAQLTLYARLTRTFSLARTHCKCDSMAQQCTHKHTHTHQPTNERIKRFHSFIHSHTSQRIVVVTTISHLTQIGMFVHLNTFHFKWLSQTLKFNRSTQSIVLTMWRSNRRFAEKRKKQETDCHRHKHSQSSQRHTEIQLGFFLLPIAVGQLRHDSSLSNTKMKEYITRTRVKRSTLSQWHIHTHK